LSRNGTGSYAKDSGQAVSRSGGRSHQVKDLSAGSLRRRAAVVRGPTAREVRSCTGRPDEYDGEPAGRAAHVFWSDTCLLREARPAPAMPAFLSLAWELVGPRAQRCANGQ